MSTNTTHPDAQRTVARMILCGRVQGVGMRPAVARLAQRLELTGFVRNNVDGVEIHVQGDTSRVELFCNQLPAGTRISRLETDIPLRTDDVAFVIRDSQSPSMVIATTVPVDTGLCDSCRDEVLHAADRRYCYPFTNCTTCGPRYSLIQSMPYDRATTSMREFEVCAACRCEYESPFDRRFHAQTNACPECGPNLSFTDPATNTSSNGFEAIRDAASAVRSGQILALKGVGGYQFICDATSTAAVQRLRELKRRWRKPFAVMVLSVEEAEYYAAFGAVERAAIREASNPIVLVTSVKDTSLSSAIHPGLNCVGLMLPSTPLHLLLLKEIGFPCVVTSGNVNAEPLTWRDADREQLNQVADVWLNHNRDIVRPVDDSVVRCIAGRPTTIRAARGIAPLSLNVSTVPQILAVGGHQKVALAVSNGRQTVLGPHIGDMGFVGARQRFVEQVEQFIDLYKARPAVIAHDMHPDFFTTRWAGDQQMQTVAVQHHHAHVVAGMIEQGWLDREVLGVAFDGTGFGTDGTVWGGEFFLCNVRSFKRIARLRPFVLPGGEKSVRQPWRIALALIQQATDAETAAEVLFWVSTRSDFRQTSQLLASPNSAATAPLTSSVGRLFDGIASLLLNITDSSYEGEPAMRLESMCDPSAAGEYTMPLSESDIMEIDWRPMIHAVLTDRRNGVAVGIIATRFTRGLARAIANICEQFRDYPVVLSGGCFQNALLTTQTARMLDAHPQSVGLPGRIPINDGGLAAGQLAVAAAQLDHSQNGGL